MSRISKKSLFYFFLIGIVFLVLAVRYLIRNPSLSLLVSTTTHIPTQDKIIALSFDDGPNPTCTPQLLSLLEKHQVKANFFLIGKQVEAYPELAQQIFEAGHQVANHSYSHESMVFKSQAYIEQDLWKTDSLLHSLASLESNWYRPPYGFSFINLPLVLKKNNKRLLTWSINPSAQYELPQDPQKILLQILEEMHPGAIIILHDGGVYADRDTLLSLVDQLILQLKKQGYRFLKLDDALKRENTFSN